MLRWLLLLTLLSLTTSPILGWDDTRFVSRKQWNALPPLSNCTINKFVNKPTLVIIHHSGSEPCSSQDYCNMKVQFIQTSHRMIGFCDIGYNFLISGDGRVYEGRGFDSCGAHTNRYNSRTLGFAFIGDFRETQPADEQIKWAQAFLDNAAKKGYLPSNFKIAGAGQLVSTLSPGEKLMDIIKKWPRFTKEPNKWLESTLL